MNSTVRRTSFEPPTNVDPRAGNVVMRRVSLILMALSVGAVLLPTSVSACTIPVFRYALEAWRPDNYEVILFHRGALSDAENDLLQPFRAQSGTGVPTPNTAVITVDLNGEVKPDFAKIWEQEPGESLPWLMVRTPYKGGNESLWSGSLTPEGVDEALASPLRKEIVRRIVSGDSVVWVLLEGTDAKQNDAIAKVVDEELSKLVQQIALPEIDPRDLESLSVSPEQLQLKFSLLRLNRQAAVDRLLVEMFLSVEADLRNAEFSDSPMLFPVFGRGRVYYPLVGAGIVAENVEDMARFLCGACQCTIKAQNPGLDLLLAVDWEQELSLVTRPAPMPPGLTGLDGFDNAPAQQAMSSESAPNATPSAAKNAEETGSNVDGSFPANGETIPSGTPATSLAFTGTSVAESLEPRADRGGMGQNILFVAGLLTVVVVVLSVTLLPRQSR